MSCEPAWRASNRLEDVDRRLRELDLLRRTHSVAIAIDGMPMAEVLAIARRVLLAEKRVEEAVRAFGSMQLASDMADAADAEREKSRSRTGALTGEGAIS